MSNQFNHLNIIRKNLYDILYNIGLFKDISLEIINQSEFKGKLVYSERRYNQGVTCLRYNKNTDEIICGDRNGWIEICNGNYNQKSGYIFIAHEEGVRSLIILPNNDIISTGFDKKIKVWSRPNTNNIYTLVCTCIHSNVVQDLVYIEKVENTYFFASCGNDKMIRIWSYKEGNKLENIQTINETCYILKLRILPNKDLISLNESGNVTMWKYNERMYKYKYTKNQVISSTIPVFSIATYKDNLVILDNLGVIIYEKNEKDKYTSQYLIESKGGFTRLRDCIVFPNGDIMVEYLNEYRVYSLNMELPVVSINFKREVSTIWSHVFLPSGELIVGTSYGYIRKYR